MQKLTCHELELIRRVFGSHDGNLCISHNSHVEINNGDVNDNKDDDVAYVNIMMC